MTRKNRPQAPDTWGLVDRVLGLRPRVLLAGPPGTGKTLAASRVGVRAGQPVVSITLTEETPAAELRGHYVPVEGRFEWRDGPAVAAWRAGARLVLNEIDRASGDALTFLMAILDDVQTASLTLPSGETVRPDARFSVVATMNGDPTSDLRPALRDRFPVAITIDAVHPEALAQLPQDLRNAAAGTTFVDESERRMSIRVWAEFAMLREVIGESFAARACFGSRSDELLTALRVAKG